MFYNIYIFRLIFWSAFYIDAIMRLFPNPYTSAAALAPKHGAAERAGQAMGAVSMAHLFLGYR